MPTYPAPARRPLLLCILAALVFVAAALAADTPPPADPADGAPPADPADEVRPANPAEDPEIKKLVAELMDLKEKMAQNSARMAADWQDDYALGLLQLEKFQIAIAQPYFLPKAREIAHDSLTRALLIYRALLDNKKPVLPTHGKLERAYLAPADMSAQPYILYVPEDYDGKKPYGLLVFLHGYSPDLNKADWGEVMYSEAMEGVATNGRCILLLPYARSNTDFQGIGEDDVRHTIAKVKKDYKIDEDRVFMSGISMGGMGAWSIAGHSPHEFAGLFVLAGRADFYMWKHVKRDSLPVWKQKMVRGEFGAELVPNYRNLPTVVVHGEGDWVMPIEQSDRMFKLLSDAGFDVKYDRLPNIGHYDWPEMLNAEHLTEYLATRKRIVAPRHVTYRTYSLKYNRAYWAEILAVVDWAKPAEIDCRIADDGENIRIRTANVAALRIRPPAALLKGESVVVDCNSIISHRKLKEAPDDAIDLGKVPAVPDGAVAKTPTFCGPIREAYTGPFLMVYAGQKWEPSHDLMMRAGVDWVRYAQGVPMMVSADKVTPQLMKRYNLIIFGTPADNPLIARLAPKLPIGIGKDAYTVGKKTYDATRYGLAMICPNPLAPDRYVVINSGRLWGTGLAPNHKFDIPPDFIIFTEETVNDGTDSNRYVCAGFFDANWRLSEKLTWHAPEPPERPPAPDPERPDGPPDATPLP